MNDELPLAARLGHDTVAAVVHAHYRRLLADPALRNFFSGIDDLPAHEKRVTAFWWGSFGGRNEAGVVRPGIMVDAHRPLALQADHLERWLALLEESLDELIDPEAAAAWMELARTIGHHMQQQGLVSPKQ